ncbi:ABC transporter ATP-binding protein [Candidatus Stoquefichus massiliensis]|uniref:ABC transporter ATP-binding protein n=1 Tax=Candidatus Stoquefichus massiliensis TaxID=1470350 RepID=UPI000484002B|nr:ABC transporter ATP-binding protein [Candidatus Stoquefichus massiliensis]
MIAIKTNNLCKHYKEKYAVKDLNLEIQDDELYSLLGVNGAGKTTTIKMLSCLIKPTSGNAEIYGFDLINQTQPIKQLINVSPQETAIAPLLSVQENLEFITEIYGFDKEKAQQKTRDIMETLQLTSIAHQKAGTLSGGWQRRLSIAMAIITEPKILFLDEPTLGLDVLARRELWDLIIQLKKKITIILTTHYLEEAENLSDHIGIMNQGQLVATGTKDELLKLADTHNFEDAFVKLSHAGGIL